MIRALKTGFTRSARGAINLSLRKACVLKEAFRVLKPGGRFYVADMVRDAAEPSSLNRG